MMDSKETKEEGMVYLGGEAGGAGGKGQHMLSQMQRKSRHKDTTENPTPGGKRAQIKNLRQRTAPQISNEKKKNPASVRGRTKKIR